MIGHINRRSCFMHMFYSLQYWSLSVYHRVPKYIAYASAWRAHVSVEQHVDHVVETDY